MTLTRFIHILLFFLFAVILFSLSTCEHKKTSEQKINIGGSARIVLFNQPVTLFPLQLHDYDAQHISNALLSSSLIKTVANGNIVAELAHAWQVGSKRITFHLKRDVKWSDGTNFSAWDVYETYHFIKDNTQRVSVDYKLDGIDSLFIADSFTVHFFYNKKIDNPLHKLQFPILNAVELKLFPQWQQIEKAYKNSHKSLGPFVVNSIDNKRIILTRNSWYKPQAALLDSLIFYFSNTSSELEQLLDNGRVDLVPDYPLNKITSLKKWNEFSLSTSNSRGFTFLGWNLKNEKISALKLRKALSWSIDRQTIVDGVLSGYGKVYDVPAFPTFWAYLQHTPYAINPQKARLLLTELGYSYNRNSQKFEMNGKPLHIRLLTSRENISRVKIAQNIKAYWENLGINVTIIMSDWPDFLQTLKTGNWDVALVSWVSGQNYNPQELLHSQYIGHDNNVMHYSNAQADSLMEQAIRGQNRLEKEKTWKLFQQKIINDLPITVLYGKKTLHLLGAKLKNVKINSQGYLINAKEWRKGARK